MQEKAFVGPCPDWPGLERNRVRPHGRPVMLQTWHNLIFLHAKVPRDLLQTLVPSQLTVEEFDGSGWLGLVAFSMSGIRPLWFPSVPWLSGFRETNLRTYVTHREYGPGVWFFSLEAARYLGCLVARQTFRLPYFHGRLSSRIEAASWRYEGRRNERQLLPSLPCQSANLHAYAISVDRTGEWDNARPNTFEYWMVERYRLYSQEAENELRTARVFHSPYVVAQGHLNELKLEGLESQFGQLDFSSVLLAKTVNVQCFSPILVSA